MCILLPSISLAQRLSPAQRVDGVAIVGSQAGTEHVRKLS